MNYKQLLLTLAAGLCLAQGLAQAAPKYKRPTTKKTTAKKQAPAQNYYSESGIPLRVEEKKDMNGVLTEKIFYRDRGNASSDTINERQLYKNGKLAESQYYTGEGKLSYAVKTSEDGKESESVFYDKDGLVHEKNVTTHGTNGTKKTVSYKKGETIRMTEISDADGRILNRIDYNDEGMITGKEICQYDGPVSACKRSECIKYRGDNSLLYKEVHDREKKRKEITRYYGSGKMQSFQVYASSASSAPEQIVQWDIYEEDGSYRRQMMQSFKKKSGTRNITVSSPTEVSYFTAEGKLKDKLNYTYDANGNELERLSYDANGKLASAIKHIYRYDENNAVNEDAVYDGTGKLLYTDVHTRNEKGKPIDIIRKKSDGTTEYLMKDGKRIN